MDRDDFPRSFKTNKLDKGRSEFMKNGTILVVHWKDNRDVYAFSSFHGNNEEEIERFRGEKIKKICAYNNKMGWVDKCYHALPITTLGEKSKGDGRKYFSRWLSFAL